MKIYIMNNHMKGREIIFEQYFFRTKLYVIIYIKIGINTILYFKLIGQKYLDKYIYNIFKIRIFVQTIKFKINLCADLNKICLCRCINIYYGCNCWFSVRIWFNIDRCEFRVQIHI